ncbi:hypothetical protein C8F01DRAFT_1121499 [Mycena amicta]|nr:hypothetical protein C8F01DRAFT_1121499 [Mycena amicta]
MELALQNLTLNSGICTIYDIPAEVLGQIMQNVLHPRASWQIPHASWTYPPFPQSTQSVNTAQTLQLLAVSRAWYRIASPLLYESISLHHIDQLPMLVRTLEERRDIAALTRSLGVCYYIPPGWDALHVAESAKLLGLCPNLTRLAFGGMIPPLSAPLAMAPIEQLDLSQESMDYPALYPILSALATSLKSLSICVPVGQEPDAHLKLTFPSLTHLRVFLRPGCVVSPDLWDLPILSSLTIHAHYVPCRPPVVALAELFGPIPTLTHLSLPPLNRWHGGFSSNIHHDHQATQRILDVCPTLRFLRVGIVQCLECPRAGIYFPPLQHARIETLHVVGRTNWPGDTRNVDEGFLKEGMPCLKAVRGIDAGVAFLDATSGIGIEEERSTPAGTWLEAFLADAEMWDEEDDEEDPDFEPESESESSRSSADSHSNSESDSDSGSGIYSDEELETSLVDELASLNVAVAVDWEMGRDEAMAIFAARLR